MAHDKLLAEWFWTDRWMGSSAFLLPMESRGLYREMLTQSWRRQARLPNNHESIRRAVGCTVEEWLRSWPSIEHYWRIDGDFLVNDTQLEIYRKTSDLSTTRAESGKLGAQSRWHGNTDSKPIAKPMAIAVTNAITKRCPPSPSPSPSPSPDQSLDPSPTVDSKIREDIRKGSASFKAGANGHSVKTAPPEVGHRAISKAIASKIATDDKVRRHAPRIR